jgi:hypothetical protein
MADERTIVSLQQITGTVRMASYVLLAVHRAALAVRMKIEYKLPLQ